MLQPTEKPPASCAPRLAASIRPGPPPVMTVRARLRRAARRPPAPARSADALSPSRALPNTDTRAADARQRVESLDELGQDAQRPPRVRCGGKPDHFCPGADRGRRGRVCSRASTAGGLHAPCSEVDAPQTPWLPASLSADGVRPMVRHGTVPPELAAFRAGLEAALLRRGYDHARRRRTMRTLVCNFVDADRRRGRTGARTSGRSWPRSGTRPDRPDDFVRTGYPVLREGAVEPLGVRRARRDGALPDARAGQLRGARRPTATRRLLRPRRRAPRAARGVEPRDREHLDARPGARAVGRRRDHRVADRAGEQLEKLNLLPAAVADRRDPLGRATSPT